MRGFSLHQAAASIYKGTNTQLLFFHDQIVLDRADPLDTSGDFTCFVDSHLSINEAAQLNDALVGFHTFFQTPHILRLGFKSLHPPSTLNKLDHRYNGSNRLEISANTPTATAPSDPPHQQKDEYDHKYQSDPAAGIGPPVLAVAPGGQGADE